MEIRLYFQMLLRGWWIILLVALVAVAMSLGISYTAVPQYQSAARFIVSPNASLGSGRDVVNSLDTLDRRSIVSTYAEVMNSNRIMANTVAALNLKPDDLKDYTYQAVVLPESSVMELTVSGPNPETAAALANAIGYQAINFTRRLNQVYDVNFLDMAVPATVPFTPQPLRDAGLALVLGVVVGAMLVILSEQIRTPIDSLRRRTMIDVSSSALSRRFFQRDLEETQARSQTGNVGLGLVQLEGLTGLVDTLPPVILQEVLHEVTRKLRNELRGNDTVGRWDDVEFSVLLPSTPAPAAERTMDRVLQALSEPIFISQSNDSVSLQPYIGLAVSQPHEAVDSLVGRAEQALSLSRRKYLTEISAAKS